MDIQISRSICISLTSGSLLLIVAFIVYAGRIVSCYPLMDVFIHYNPEQMRRIREACQMDSRLISQLCDFLVLYTPGIILFSVYWLL
jgi:hypothetical protein